MLNQAQGLPTPERQRDISSAASDISGASNTLSQAVAELEARLAPLLSDCANAGEGPKAIAYSCELARAMQQEAAFVRGQAERIFSMLSRLEI